MTREAGPSLVRKHIDREQATLKPLGVEPAPPAPDEERFQFHQLMNNKEFAAMLDSYSDPSLVETFARFREQAPTEGDMQTMEDMRDEYISLDGRARTLDAEFDKRFIEVRKSSADLDRLCATFGEDAFKETFKQGIREMAFRDVKGFDTIESQFAKIETAEKMIEDPESPVNQVLNGFLAAHPVGEERLLSAMAMSGEDQRTNEIRGLIREQMGRFGRAWDSYKKLRGKQSSLTEAQAMSRHKDEIDRAKTELESSLLGSGAMLHGLMTQNAELRTAFVRAASRERPTFQKGIEAQMPYDALRSEKLDLGHVARSWKEFLRDHHIDFHRSDLDAEARDKYRDLFMRTYANAQMKDRKGGFWAKVMKFLFGTKHRNDPRVKKLLN